MAPLAPEVLIAQLVMADFSGLSPSPDITRLIGERHLGGVILFPKNIERPGQVAALCGELQDLARRAGSPPLLIAVDQEGGPVERLPLGMPGAMALGAAHSPEFAEEAGHIAGRALRAVGANVDFAPVLDVSSNPANPVIGIRSFGADPNQVARLGGAFAAGLHAAGVVAAGKHFPGHGDADVDSHLALPVVAHGRDRLEAVEFLPFRRSIRDGLGALMTAHVAFTAFGMLPATLSPPILEGLLRREWGFDGVIFTDSLAMAPLRDLGAGRAAVLALLAGADVVLACGGPGVPDEVLGSVRRAVDEGILSLDRLAQSHARIQRLRARLASPLPSAALETIFAAAPITEKAAEIARRAVTLVRNDARLVPLPDAAIEVVTLLPEAASADERAGRSTLGAALRALRRPVQEVILAPEEPWDAARRGGPLIVVTQNRGRPAPWQVEIVRRAYQARGDGALVVATGTPYDLLDLPPVSTYAVTYGREAALLAAAAGMLGGAIPPRGRLPVALSDRYPVGWGISW